MTRQLDRRDPSDTARAVFDAVDGQRWSEVAALGHPDSLESFKSNAVQALREQQSRHQAQQGLTQDLEWLPPPGYYERRFGVASLAELESLSPADLVVRRAETGWARLQPITNPITRDVLGHVLETPDYAHVVYRQTMQLANGSSAAMIWTIPMKLGKGLWYTERWDHLPSGWEGYPPVE